MKKVYSVSSAFGQVFVLAESYGEAEKIYTSHYWPTVIKSIDIYENEVLLDMKGVADEKS